MKHGTKNIMPFSRRHFITAAGLLVPAVAAFPGIIISNNQLFTPSAPSNGISGPIEEGVQVTFSPLAGEDFGVGPTTVLFDPMNSGTNGATITTGNPLVGAYDSVQAGPIWSNAVTPRHGNVALCCYSTDTATEIRQLRTSWTPAQTVAIRYWWHIPIGDSIPDAFVAGGYSTETSSNKLFWLGTSPTMAGGTDVCIPTFHGTTSCAISGNGNTTTDSGCAWDYPNSTIQNHFRYGQWVMVECLQDATTSTVRINHCSSLLGMARYSSEGRANYWGDSATQYWSHGNLPGYIRDRPDWVDPGLSCHIYHQDYCLKTGNGAWADVFIGNALTIDTCTDVRHFEIESWGSDIVGRPRGIEGIESWPIRRAFIRKADNSFLPAREFTLG